MRWFLRLSLSLVLTTLGFAQSKTFVYTADTLGGSISIYFLNPSTGALIQTGNSPVAFDTPGFLAPALGGRFLVVSGGTCAVCGIATFGINPTNGALEGGKGFSQVGSVIFQGAEVITDPSGATLYAGGSVQPGNGTNTGVLDALRVNSDGSLTQLGSPFAFGQNFNPGALAVDPHGRWVFAVAEVFENSAVQQFLFSIKRSSTGALEGAAGAPVNITDQKCHNVDVLPSIAIDPQGKNLFLACDAASSQNPAADFTGVQDYSIDQTTGQLSRRNFIATRTGFQAAAVDRQGWRVFSTSEGSDVVEVFDFNRFIDSLGVLNGGAQYKTGSQPNGVAVDPTNRFVYVTNGTFCYPKGIGPGCMNNSSANINGYFFNYPKGTLTPLAGSPFPSKQGVRGMIFVTVP